MPLRYAEPAAEAYRFPLTIRHLLDGVVARAGTQRIVYRDQVDLSYADFVARTGRLANVLARLGVVEGTTVAVMDWDSHRYLEAYFAIPMMGAVLQTANVRLPIPQLAYTLDHARAEVLLVHRDFLPIVEEILPDLPGVRAVVALMDGDDALPPAWTAGEYEALLADADADYPFVDFDEDAVATTFYTTGTTGQPKGVCFTHRQLVLHTLAVTGPFGASGAAPGFGLGDVYMPLTPMFHVHAWGVPYVATMLGLKQVYPGRYDPAMICRLREAHGVSYSHCVPTVLEMVLHAAEQTGADLRGWKMTIGGSALTSTLCRKARAAGMDVAVGYGMSETCPLIAMAARRAPGEFEYEELAVSALTAAGLAGPLVSVRIVDEQMIDVPSDGVSRGELIVRAPWLTPCYVGDARASDQLWRGGWLHTQDVATIDPSGVIRIRDRMKDVIKTGGEWVDSIHLEELVASAEGVVEVSVIGVPDERWGERPLAVVVAASDCSPTLEQLNAPVERAIAEGAITRYAKLDRFVLVELLPRTSVGKINKKALRESLER